MEINQYRIVLVRLDRTSGSEIGKTRPCVVISPEEMNRYLQTIVVAPMTNRSRNYPTRVPVKHDKKKGWIVADQIITIDRLRIIRVLGELSDTEIQKLKDTIKETYVD